LIIDPEKRNSVGPPYVTPITCPAHPPLILSCKVAFEMVIDFCAKAETEMSEMIKRKVVVVLMVNK
jgi:hypothetical protein